MLSKRDVLKNYNEVLDKVRSITASDVTVIAVTKAHEPEIFQICADLNIRHVGENRVQELKEKCDAYPAARSNLYVHFIGNVQSNKAKYLPGHIDSLDSLDSLEVLHKLTARLNAASEQIKPIAVLLQLNTSGEIAKSGLDTADYNGILEFAKTVQQTEGVKLEGVMTMGPTPDDDFDMENPAYRSATKKSFLLAAGIKDRLQNDLGCALPRLSMGMSHDFELAVECGAGEIRVGSMIFGDRPPRH